MKKILLLGGSEQQIIAIKTAKKMGLYTILCDFLQDNPGQLYADKFYLASTTDKEKILEIAQEENIDGILAYASDPAAPTAAYVAEKLNLPGNPYKSVDILCNKDKFRKFLKDNGFCTPVAKGYRFIEDALSDLNNNIFTYPVIVKPVDSSGSKGVSQINSIEEASEKIINAFDKSRSKRIIIENFVYCKAYQIAGDGLSINGELVFKYFGNDHFKTHGITSFVPISASFPCILDKGIQDKVHEEIQRLISLLGMRNCTYNFDIRVDSNNNVYLMEVAPRDGGNYIPQIIKYATGVDLVDCSIKMAIGETSEIKEKISPKGYWSYFAIHSLKSGNLKNLYISNDVKQNIVENHIIKKPGDKIDSFCGSNATLGILLMKFETVDEMLDKMDNHEKWINVEVQ